MNAPFRFACAAAVTLLMALSTTPAAAQSAPKVLKKVPLDFPDRAVRMGVDKGVLKTRVTIDGTGAVTAVEVVEATPPKARVLNETVVETLRDWKFEASGKSQTFEVQLVLSAT